MQYVDPLSIIEPILQELSSQKNKGKIISYNTLRDTINNNKFTLSEQSTVLLIKIFLNIFDENYSDHNKIFKEISTQSDYFQFFFALITYKHYLTDVINIYKEQITILCNNPYFDISYKNALCEAGLGWVIENFINQYDYYLRKEYEFNYLIKADYSRDSISNEKIYNIDLNFSGVIHNNDAYNFDSIQEIDSSYTKSSVFEPLPGLPIGYNIHIPKNNVKAIIVEVYGGHQASDRLKDSYKPGVITAKEHNILLNENITVITLNLVDLLELVDQQFYMSQSLYNKIQHSIHLFYEILRNNPATLQESLVVLKNLPITLSGFSFGSTITAAHAGIYPEIHTIVIYATIVNCL